MGLLAAGLTVFASPGGVSTLGDFVWFDENGNGVKDESPEWGNSGIDGVLVNLYLDDADGVFEPGTDDTLTKQMTTGDNPGTTEVERGWYDFTEIGDHLGWWVEIPDSNFDHGGPLEGYEYTGNNASNAYNGPEPRYESDDHRQRCLRRHLSIPECIPKHRRGCSDQLLRSHFLRKSEKPGIWIQ
ncbi:MAG TPA: hypothetical protein G4N94_10555 [Caldilineae bacterium]|nr:hypothetical protein [Caldilineae bacterium]